MTREEVRSMLNRSNLNYYEAVREFSKFVSGVDNKYKILEYIYEKARQKKKVTPLDLLQFFMDVTIPVVENTRLCKTRYNSQMFIKTIWTSASFQRDAIEYIKNYESSRLLYKGKISQTLKEEKPKEEKPEAVKPNEEKPKEELTVHERRVRQAQRMRDAKAKKARERKQAEEAKNKPADKPVQKPQVKESPKVNTQTGGGKKQLSKEQLEHIEMLKRMSVR